MSLANGSRVAYLAWLLRSKVLAVLNLTGYFDEAGIHAQAPVIVVAGYVSPQRDWRRLEVKWKKVLDEEDANFYHTTDIEADPPRGIYKGWTRAKADRLTDRLVPIAARYAGRVYGVHILARVWYAAVPFVETLLPNRPHDAPYLLLAREWIDTVINTQDKDSTEQIGFVFADNEYRHQLLDGYEAVKNSNARPALLGPLAYDQMADNVMLQAADLIAWHYRRSTEIFKELRNEPYHRAVKSLMWS
jgi:hypothetical protein